MIGSRRAAALAAPALLALAALSFGAPAAAAEPKVGDKAPAWELSDWVNSRPYKLAQLSGKAVLLEFWASW